MRLVYAGVLVLAALQSTQAPGAKVLFYDPTWGDPQAIAAVPPSPESNLVPIRPAEICRASPDCKSMGFNHVGLHYWLEDQKGARYASAADAPAGIRVRLHLRVNAGGFLNVWVNDGTSAGVQLTPLQDRFGGYRIAADVEYVVPGELYVSAGETATRLIFLHARAQMEQVATAREARDKLARIAARVARDQRGPVLISESDRSTPGQVGTYVVHREGGQTAGEISLGRN